MLLLLELVYYPDKVLFLRVNLLGRFGCFCVVFKGRATPADLQKNIYRWGESGGGGSVPTSPLPYCQRFSTKFLRIIYFSHAARLFHSLQLKIFDIFRLSSGCVLTATGRVLNSASCTGKKKLLRSTWTAHAQTTPAEQTPFSTPPLLPPLFRRRRACEHDTTASRGRSRTVRTATLPT